MHNLAIHGYVQKFMETYCNVHVISTSYIILHFQPDSIRLLFKVLDQRLAASNGEIRWEWSSFFGICTPNLVAIQKNKPRFSGSLSPIVCGLWVLLWSCTTSHFLFSVWPSWPIWSYPQKDVHETHPSLNHVFFLVDSLKLRNPNAKFKGNCGCPLVSPPFAAGCLEGLRVFLGNEASRWEAKKLETSHAGFACVHPWSSYVKNLQMDLHRGDWCE